MSIFTAIGSLVGGLLGSSAAKKQQQQQQAWQEHMAKNQVRFRVEDAKAAGVHPLAALGASLTSPAATSINLPDYAEMGQNVGRALDATMTKDDKDSDYTRAAQALTLEKMSLENQLIKSNLVASALRTTNQVGNPPTFDALAGKHDQGEQKGDPTSIFEHQVDHHPDYVDAEKAEKRYGDSSDWIEGWQNRWGDMKWNYERALMRLLYGARRPSRGPGGYHSRSSGW